MCSNHRDLVFILQCKLLPLDFKRTLDAAATVSEISVKLLRGYEYNGDANEMTCACRRLSKQVLKVFAKVFLGSHATLLRPKHI